MEKIFKALKIFIITLIFGTSFIACDKDFSVIESNVLSIENANFFKDSIELPIVAYNKRLDSLQSNNLPSNLLGVFHDPDYGKTTASVVTQLNATSFDGFGTNPVIDSVVINIPYFSTINGVENDNITYQIDSIYGNADAEFKLTIFENKYFLRDLDPFGEVNTFQNYFSKAENNENLTENFVLNGSQKINFDDHLGSIIFSGNIKPDPKSIVFTTGEGTNVVETRSAPAFRFSFKSETELQFWKDTFTAKNGSVELSNLNNFKNYFRGLYFKAEAIGNDGNMFLLDTGNTNANITIHYTKGESTARIPDNYVLSFSGTTLNTFINEFNLTLENGNKQSGDETLYLKGLEGSMAVVDLFPTAENLADFMNQFKDSEGNPTRLINEAHLEIHDKVTDNEFHRFDRIYAYDVKNNTTTIDYIDALDPTLNTQNPEFSKFLSLGLRDDSGKFKIRLTEHLNNIIQNDSTNYKIGIVLSNNVNLTASAEILDSEDDVTRVPRASILSPRGTILHGNNSSNNTKRLKLKVFFTE